MNTRQVPQDRMTKEVPPTDDELVLQPNDDGQEAP